jgi:hypothetical protein
MNAYQRRLSAETRQKIVILEPNDFFKDQVNQCRFQADCCANKHDRRFWLQLATRWEKLLHAGSVDKAEQKLAANAHLQQGGKRVDQATP